MSHPLQFALGDTFGSWTVIDAIRVVQRQKSFYWVQCVCGKIGLRSASKLQSPDRRSCVCIGVQVQSARVTKHGGKSYGQTTRLYGVWLGMKQRCSTNPQSHDYPVYAARGITVCDTWKHDFIAFREWALSHGYAPGLYMDRRNNDLGYSPENCRFVTARVNSINRRITHLYAAFGDMKTLSDWARDPRCSVCLGTLSARVGKRQRWDIERAILTPPLPYKIRAFTASASGNGQYGSS